MIRVFLLRYIVLCGFLPVLASCGRDENLAADVALLATDIHVEIAQHSLVLPFIALENYAYQSKSFSLSRNGDSERALGERSKFLHDTADSSKPLVLDRISLVSHWVDSDVRPQQVCSRLAREWARSLCNNPWAATRQALPYNRFELVDLRRLRIEDSQGPAHCRDDGKSRRPLPQESGHAVMVCIAMTPDGDDDKYHRAVLRINGDLGALWTVWRHGQNGETAEAMTQREGMAIFALVKYALGHSEDFSALQAQMCRLSRPGSVDHLDGAACEREGRIARI